MRKPLTKLPIIATTTTTPPSNNDGPREEKNDVDNMMFHVLICIIAYYGY